MKKPLRAFVCQIVPQNRVIDLPNISQAGNNFCHRFISLSNPDIVFSMIPVNIVKKEKFSFNISNQVVEIQVRFFPHKSILKIANALFENLLLVFKLLKLDRNTRIWYYNLTSYNLLSVILLKFIFGRRIFFVIADYQPPRKNFSIDNVILKVIASSNGVISLSDNFLRNRKRELIVLPGIVGQLNQMNSRVNPKNNKFLFSGALSGYTGIKLALEIFSTMPELELHISGQGELLVEVIKYSEKYSNIHYHGFMTYDEYIEILNSVSVCLSFRDPGFAFNTYNFPSKILEFMSHKKLVLSTMKYNTLEDNSYLYCDFSIEEVKKKLCEIKSLTDLDYIVIIDRAGDSVQRKFSETNWQNSIRVLES